MADEPGESGKAASPDELYAAVEKLTAAELEHLAAVGDRLALGVRDLDGSDVLMEGIERALRGTSVWRRGVPLQSFLFGIMRNVAKQRREQKSASAPRVPILGHASDEAIGVALPSSDPNPEQVILDAEAQQQLDAEVRNTLRSIDTLFDDDIEIQAILYGIRYGNAASQVQREFGMSETQYASARRRMKRKLAKAFPVRFKS